MEKGDKKIRKVRKNIRRKIEKEKNKLKWKKQKQKDNKVWKEENEKSKILGGKLKEEIRRKTKIAEKEDQIWKERNKKWKKCEDFQTKNTKIWNFYRNSEDLMFTTGKKGRNKKHLNTTGSWNTTNMKFQN